VVDRKSHQKWEKEGFLDNWVRDRKRARRQYVEEEKRCPLRCGQSNQGKIRNFALIKNKGGKNG